MNEGGVAYKSADHPGVFIIENYFLGCSYCNENAPNVHEMAQQYAMVFGIQVLDLGIDRNDSQYATWISRHHPEHPVLKDANKTLTRQLGTSAYPSAYVLDCNLKVTHKVVGVWGSQEKAELREAVEAARVACGL